VVVVTSIYAWNTVIKVIMKYWDQENMKLQKWNMTNPQEGWLIDLFMFVLSTAGTI
jgi:hypothetical protein